RDRLDRRQGIAELAGGDRLDAIGRAGKRHDDDLEAGIREPAQLGGDGIRRCRRRDRACAPADSDRGLGLGGPARSRDDRCNDCEFHSHGASPLFGVMVSSFCDGSQNSTRRRTTVTRLFSSRPSMARINSTENWPATSMVKLMLVISMPRPDSEPINSATMAPIRAKIMAISSPAKMYGSALGSRSIQKIWPRVAASERIRLTRSSSAERRPTMVLTISGKNGTSAALTIFDVRPSPNQTMISGASATFGIDWNMTMKG